MDQRLRDALRSSWGKLKIQFETARKMRCSCYRVSWNLKDVVYHDICMIFLWLQTKHCWRLEVQAFSQRQKHRAFASHPHRCVKLRRISAEDTSYNKRFGRGILHFLEVCELHTSSKTWMGRSICFSMTAYRCALRILNSCFFSRSGQLNFDEKTHKPPKQGDVYKFTACFFPKCPEHVKLWSEVLEYIDNSPIWFQQFDCNS